MLPGTFVEVLARRAASQGGQTALTFLGPGGEAEAALSYAELDARARGIAAALRSVCQPGDRVLLLFPPGLTYVAAFFGCLYAGVLAVPVYLPRGDKQLPRLAGVIADATPTAALSDEATLAKAGAGLRALLSDLAIVPVDGLSGDQAATPGELAFLQYTSGSTGDPKGVRVSHGNLLHNSGLIHAAFRHGPGSVALLWVPPYHDMGLIGGILQPIFGGFPGVLMSPLAFLKRPLGWLRAIDRWGATTSGGPNFGYELCLERLRPQDLDGLDLSRWTLAFNGAEPVRAETLDRFAQAFAPAGFQAEAFYPCYGLAEATLLVSGGPAKLHNGRVSSGQVAAGLVVKIDGDGEGEIMVSGPCVAGGYWLHGPFGTWLRTGDLGYFAPDGELVVTGRLKDLIIVAGANHYPQDLEATACAAHPCIRAAGAVAFALPAPGTTDGVGVVIVAEADRNAAEREAAVQAIRRAVAAAHDLVLADVVLVDAGQLPRTSSGKVRRGATRDAYLVR